MFRMLQMIDSDFIFFDMTVCFFMTLIGILRENILVIYCCLASQWLVSMTTVVRRELYCSHREIETHN